MNCELIDTHCHLNDPKLADRVDETVEAAHQAGVVHMIDVICSGSDIGTALAILGRHANVSLVAGIHPHEAGKFSPEDLDRVVALWRNESRVVAAGELGLDYFYDFSPRPVQQALFRKQLELLDGFDLPLVIHSRNAQADTIAILREFGYENKPVVFHCFSGTAPEAAELRAHGWWTSFTGIITFKNAAGPRQACLETPLDQLMFETDCPYLSPEPIRHVRPNEPQYMVHTVRFAAEQQGMAFEELARISTENARRFYRLKD